MSYTWGQAKAEIGRILGDDDTAEVQSWPYTLRLDAINAALRAFASHTGVLTGDTITGDGTTDSYTLPDNVLERSDVYLYDVADEEWWNLVSSRQGIPLGLTPDGTRDDQYYYEYPEGTLQLGRVLASGEAVKRYFYAYWNEVPTATADSTELDVPRWAREALVCYAAAYCLHPSATNTASIKQYDQQIDSGNPEHNPLDKRQQRFMDRYRQILASYSPQDRSAPWDAR